MSEGIGRPKVALYARLADGADAGTVAACAAAIAPGIVAGLDAGVDARVGMRIVDFPEVEHIRLMAASPPPFDFAFLLVADDADRGPMEAAAAAMADALGDVLVDREVLVGREVAITSGDGPVFVTMPLRRLPALDRPAFMQAWFGVHAQLGVEVPGVRYRQNHVDVAATDALKARVGGEGEALDGLAESYFDTVDHAFAIMSQPSVEVDAIVDEKRFIDHSRSRFAFYDTIWRREG
ncbi:MAG TPA: EthD domain-containing protein [Croceicoccus sp.]|nr:EthD domain-containing protein [Croceicoccus sp.]